MIRVGNIPETSPPVSEVGGDDVDILQLMGSLCMLDNSVVKFCHEF